MPHNKRPEQPLAKIQKLVKSPQPNQTIFTLRIMLNGHKEYMLFEVPETEHDRVMKTLQYNSTDTFVCFDAVTETVLVRLDQISLVNFCWDFAQPQELSENQDELDYSIQVFFRGSDEPIIIGVDPDSAYDPEEDEEMGQIGHAVFMVEFSDDEKGDSIFIEDEDGEPVIINVNNICMMRVPKILTPTS